MKSIIVLTTQSCPKCPAFKQGIANIAEGVSVRFVPDTDPDFMKFVTKYDLTTAPVGILLDNDGETVLIKSDTVEEIKKLL